MDPVIAALIGTAVGLAIGALVAWLVARSRGQAALRLAEAQHAAAVGAIRVEQESALGGLRAETAAALATADALQEQIAAAAAQYKDLVDRGERDARERLATQQAESKVLQALSPVAETLSTLRSKVETLEEQRAQQHGELQNQLKAATEGEERLRATAENLAAALRNNSVRGVWGETQLRTLVESAGLIKHVDFHEQASITVDGDARRPDMIVNLPGGKQIAVDSKVPYNDYIEASGAQDDARRRELLVSHARKVKGHVDALATKGYWNGLEASPDFTIAFIPNEALLSAALDADPALMEYAFGRGIILASPVSFWAALKTVAFTWRQDVLTEDAKNLFSLSKELYTRLATLAGHADTLRKRIDDTVGAYNAFASSLETRVLVTARKLGDLDESKVLAEPKLLESRPNQLAAAELVAELPGESDPELAALLTDEG